MSVFAHPYTSQLLLNGPTLLHDVPRKGFPIFGDNCMPFINDHIHGQALYSQNDAAKLASLQSFQRITGSSVMNREIPYMQDKNNFPIFPVDPSFVVSTPYFFKEGNAATEFNPWTGNNLINNSGYFPYDPTLAAYSYINSYDFSARRKNATRESTSTLKSWFHEHEKNPYPTKGEKIMLAIITKMTLTQVSTWFANARRRLKKNKLIWKPKDSKTDYDLSMNDDGDKMALDEEEDEDCSVDKSNSVAEEMRCAEMSRPILFDASALEEAKNKRIKTETCAPAPVEKPKIWSLADTATSKAPPLPIFTGSETSSCSKDSVSTQNLYSCSVLCLPELESIPPDTPPQTPPNMKVNIPYGQLPLLLNHQPYKFSQQVKGANAGQQRS